MGTDRNAPCPCGSGKKYKRCCGLDAPAPAPISLPPLASLLVEAIQKHQGGRIAEAKALYEAILTRSPRHEDALHLLGMCLHQEGRQDEALDLVNRALAIKPKEAVFHNTLGAIHRAKGNETLASQSFLKALALNPAYPEALNNYGLSLKAQDRLDEAINHFRKALAQNPRYLDALVNLGQCQNKQGELAAASDSFERAVKLNPGFWQAWEGLGDTRTGQGFIAEALECYLNALDRNPDSAHLNYCVAQALEKMGNREQAVEYYRQAVAIQPDYLLAMQCLANLLTTLERYEECIPYYREILEAKPDFVSGFVNLGFALKNMGDLAGSVENLRKAIALAPNDLGNYFALGLSELALGEILAGWRHYAASLPGRSNATRETDLPLWKGEPLEGKTLLITGEQGIGDELLFNSLSPDLVAQAARTYIECTPKLAKLFRHSFPTATIIPRTSNKELPETDERPDFWVPIGNIPQWTRPTLESFGNGRAYLTPNPERVAYWKKRLAEMGPEHKVGICWRSLLMWVGRLKHYTDLGNFLPLLHHPGCAFINLQYTDCAAEIADASQRFGITIHRFPEVDLLNDLHEAAALTVALDLTISVGTSVLQTAGALGMETWGILPEGNWISLGCGNRLPWYPRTRVFTHGKTRSWEETINLMTDELTTWIKSKAR